MPRHYNTGRARGPRPRYVWVPGRIVEDVATAATVQTTDVLANYNVDAGREVGPGMVIERIIGSMQVESIVTGSGGDFAAGLLVVPEGSLGSFPDPQTEINDYLVWIGGFFPSGANEQAAGTFQPDQWEYRFDVRSRRRIRSMGDEVRWFVRNPNSTGRLFNIQTRILLRVT